MEAFENPSPLAAMAIRQDTNFLISHRKVRNLHKEDVENRIRPETYPDLNRNPDPSKEYKNSYMHSGRPEP